MTTLTAYLNPTPPPDLDDLKAYLGISGDTENARLTIWFTSAIEAGDNYMNNLFQDSAGAEEDPPTTAVLGCYEYVKALREYWGRQAGLSERKTASLTEKYTGLPAGNFASQVAGRVALQGAIQFWYQYKTDVSLAGVA